MTIVNRGAIPVLMTHGFTGNNVNPSPTDIKECFRELNFLKSDFGEVTDIDDLADWQFNAFSNSYEKDSEYWKWFYDDKIHGMNDAKEGWFSIHNNNKDKNYFVVEIFSQTAFALFPLEDITGKYFDRIVSGDVHLLICMSLHGYHETPDRLYQDIIIKYGINPENITLQQESHDMLEALEIASYKYQLPKFNLVCGMEMEHFAQQEILLKMTYDNLYPAYPSLKNSLIKNLYPQEPRSPMRPLTNNEWPGLNINTLQYKNYHKKFLSFNGQGRIQRSLLVHLLAITDLLDKGIVSYNVIGNAENFNGKEVYQMLQNIFIYNEELCTLLRKNQLLIESIDNIPLDIAPLAKMSDLRDSGIDITRVNNTDYYEDSYFSVISETSFPHYRTGSGDITEIGRILSEKTLKAISMKHPFILLTNPHALKLLREIGYKTFHPLIDETYDGVTDPAVRICMIINEVKKLCALEGDDLKHFLYKAKKICDYNFHHLLTKKKFHYNLIP